MSPKKIKNFFSHPASLVKEFKEFNLISIQTDSFRWFREKGLRILFDEISPIRDHSNKEFELHFRDYYFDEPKFSVDETREKALTYEAPLRVNVELVNLIGKKNIKQEIYFGDFPMMTERGTFIINGVERIVTPQLVRSPGVYFVAEAVRGKKLFGAKIIPARGSWLEFESDSDGAMEVKIDRHRKVPATALLRVFGFSDEEIKKAFDQNEAERKAIESTLKKDSAKDVMESYMEVYRRLRPGDLATPESAKNLIDAMFKRLDRYSLSEVGRFKLNQRLRSLLSDSPLIGADDLVEIIREIIRLNNDSRAEGDDIDHLGNRRIRAVGELLEGRMRLGFNRMRRIIQDRMSTVEKITMTPVQLVNTRPLVGIVRDFFATSSLSQFMDQVNPLAELEHKRRISALGPGGLTKERAGFEVRDVHPSHYGRLCPIETPEGQNIGLINYLSTYAHLNQYGFLETPYVKLAKGYITDQVVWLDALEEERYRIVHAGEKLDENNRLVSRIVEARYQTKPINLHREEADLMDVSPEQMLSIAASLIPFLENDDAKRALMGANMQKQAVPSLKPEVPLVGTGVEVKAAENSGHLILAETDGEVISADAAEVVISGKNGKKAYKLDKFRMTNQGMAFSHRSVVMAGDKVKKGEVVAEGPAIKNGRLALGQNLLVAFIPWEGANFEDAVVISERVVEEDRFTSVHVEDFIADVRDTKLGPEITTPDIPNVSEEKLKNLDEEGIIRIGAEASAGDILVGKISPKGEIELTSEERLLRAIFGEKARDVKNASLEVPHGKGGRVVGVKIFEREKGDKLEPGVIKRIQVQVASLRNIQAGDKMAGRHGNKGVISQIRPVEDMPYLEDGTPVDIILNPLGVASRMNLGQILETHLGWAAEKAGYIATTPSLSGATEKEIAVELKAAGLPESGQVTAYDGRTGKPFANPVTIGVVYMMKLNHLVADKVHMRSIGPYSLITQQPLGGRAQFGGQRFGEMEVWALEGYGATHALQEMLTIKSDDVVGRASSYEAIVRGEKIKKPNIPATFNVMMNELKALGINIEIIEDDKNGF
jgi:DNA-directed RNA polymerase subunit beta